MPARLILNADDFGLTPGVNRSIAELNDAGIVLSATLMARGAAFDDAITIARSHPTLGIGCHVVLTDGAPVSPPHIIRTLLGPDGVSFRPSLNHFVFDLLLGRIDQAEIEREALAQIHKLHHAGIAVTHLDTHKHTHIFPRVARALLAAAEHARIPSIRNPFEQPWSLAIGTGTLSRRLQLRIIHHLRPRFMALPQIRSGRVLTTDGTLGISATGHLNATTLSALLAAMPEGTWELVCHPGYNDRDLDAITTRLRTHRETERNALISEIPKMLLRPQPLKLIHYGDLASYDDEILILNP